MKLTKFALFALLLASLNACKKDDDNTPTDDTVNTIPEFYKPAPASEYGKTAPNFLVIANAAKNINKPQDLDFNPLRPGELWVLNRDEAPTGGSTVTISNAGDANRSFEYLRDGNARHFMALPTAISFGNNGFWATTAGIQDANHSGGTFTGPTLWSADMNIYAKPSGANGSHMDMLHGSPYSMGIAHDHDNVYWVFDGYNEHICRYDFAEDHGPGNDDHSDGKIHRYTEVNVKRSDKAPAHIVLDKQSGYLYIADAGNKRILQMNTKTGVKSHDLSLVNEVLEEHWAIGGVEWKALVNNMPQEPTGIALKANRLFVSEYATGDIIAYDVTNGSEIGRLKTGKAGITGLVIGPDNKLWYTNNLTHEVIRIDP